jgi:hypothetical protein
MLDKILGKKDKDKKDVPDLRKEDKKDDSDIGGRLKEMVSKATEKSKEGGDSSDKGDKKLSSKKMPRPVPRPRPKPMEKKPKLKIPSDKEKKPGIFGGIGGDVGKKISDDDQKTMVGAAVFGIILIVLVGAGYYFLVYGPYQEALNTAKVTKINEVNAYFKGPLAVDPRKQSILAEIESGVTPEQVLAVDVIGPATGAWREYQSQEINIKKDPYGRVMITYAASGQKNLMMKVVDAQKIVNEADATVLANMEIKTPDTVVIPIWITRLQAAGGLINVGDSVDVYFRGNTTSPTTANVTNATNGTNNTTVVSQPTVNDSTPRISGATVLAILRAQSSGSVSANMNDSTSFATNYFSYSASQSQSAQKDVEQLLRAAASRNMNEGEINSLLNAYGWRLSDFERVSNLGELDAQYMVLLEVPRENAMFVIQNSEPGNPLVLVVPTQKAPEWMIKELQTIYGSG